MKIGILTYQRAENYGALLQSYASFTYLKKIGYDVEFVDYWPKYHERHFNLLFTNFLSSLPFTKKVPYFMLSALSLPWLYKRKKNFIRFMHERLNLPSKVTYRSNDLCDKYDVVLYGSDQIWRKQKVLSNVFYDDWYFGSNNISAGKKIAMAASTGPLHINEKDQAYFRDQMKNFASILVRENDLQAFLSSMHIPSQVVVDPVFLLNAEEWKNLINKVPNRRQNEYILFYNLLRTSESTEFAEKLSEKYGYDIVELNKGRMFRYRGKRYVKSAGVEEFLSLIYNAAFVVSNSFHGVALSVIFEKQFYAVGMRDKSERVNTLLGSLHIKDRLIDDTNSHIALDTQIDYNAVNGHLNRLRNQFQTLLTASIEKE